MANTNCRGIRIDLYVSIDKSVPNTHTRGVDGIRTDSKFVLNYF